jgi:hypothetical protein
MDSSELLARKREIASKLQECWMAEGSIISVLLLAVSEAGSSEGRGAIAFGVVTSMHDAFEMSLGEAKRISQWHAIGGNLSDREIESRIGTLIPRDRI